LPAKSVKKKRETKCRRKVPRKNKPSRHQFFLDSRAFRPETVSVSETAYLSLGSNLGDRAANLGAAIVQLEAAGHLSAVSAMYETQPVDVPNQPWFLNCVVALETDFTPRQLLNFALQIESSMGRLRMREKGARNIDIDIILFGGRIIDEPGLKIPHPAMHHRRFVLEPLVEIAPHAQHPEKDKTAQELLAALPGIQTVRRL
jgi:2-amino-4-hydroxy-6-hydroxymethyldihydropteridine diphosphokinase